MVAFYTRKWTKTESPSFLEGDTPLLCRHIQFYDGGDTIGWLTPSGVWSCWRLLGRVQTPEGTIVESLEAMPEDWCPFILASVESYPVVSETGGALEIPGWRITTRLNE